MSKVFFDVGLSLEGYLSGENRSPRNPLGDNGPAILDWMFRTKAFWKVHGREGGEEDGARAAADGKDVRINGGADTIRQFLNAGLIDEFILHIAPLVLGNGIRLFEHIDPKLQVNVVEAISSPRVTHLKYVVKK